MNPDQLQFIRTIKGAPATILILMMIRGSSMTNLEICRWTGYSDKPVTTALSLLQHLGLIQDNGRAYGWSLSSGIRQLPLTFGALSEWTAEHPNSISSNHSSPNLSTEIGDIPISSATDRKNSDLPARSATAGDLRSSLQETPDHQQQQQSKRDRKNSDLQLLVRAIGIRPPARTVILAAPPSTALAWWFAACLDAKELSSPVGWFIRRIQTGEDPPIDLESIANVWLSLTPPYRRELRAAGYDAAEDLWFAHGLGPSNAETAWQIERAGGFDYAD